MVVRNMYEELRDRWTRLLTTDTSYFDDIIVFNYAKSQRRYHNLHHIETMFVLFDVLKQKKMLEDPDAVETAIFFHDLVYQPDTHSNERNSMKSAVALLKTIGRDEDFCMKVAGLIMATTHSSEPLSPDGKYMVDMDLASLGAAPDVFRKNQENILLEGMALCPHYSDVFIISKNLAVCRRFLDREKIYYTPYFTRMYEVRARLNLQQHIKEAEHKLQFAHGREDTGAY